MNLNEIEKELIDLKNSVRTLQDITEIKNLQKTYGYYLEHMLCDGIIDLFSDGPDVSITFPYGVFLGKEGVTRYFKNSEPIGEKKPANFLHEYLMANGVVHVEPDGKTAKGRWYGLGFIAVPVGDGSIWEGIQSICYENEYVKEDGKWKIKKLNLTGIFSCPWEEGWVDPKLRNKEGIRYHIGEIPKPDLPGIGIDTRYPQGYMAPFHFKHPITGKEVRY
jgi:hypothetical protein